jgi:hypothetical protein
MKYGAQQIRANSAEAQKDFTDIVIFKPRGAQECKVFVSDFLHCYSSYHLLVFDSLNLKEQGVRFCTIFSGTAPRDMRSNWMQPGATCCTLTLIKTARKACRHKDRKIVIRSFKRCI